ncbi:hypothetical protein LOTGIDRAFT_156555 [Lottia gigantea]|uniref:Ionotropic glutamate receptor L-glutamate and glycine-binding domain-containing protein n=1 Tax=Lottia gigantea TaxID=225164 RepID=V4BDW0_LOTGI|nr:hypothetical protein LOTGIDRAFT_156555 [Lottia gigantea]ESP03952.1 hypothetical protein LOTGIDRAFT_156555 [Lottia gigantea]
MLPVYLLVCFLSSCRTAQIVLLTDKSDEVTQLESKWKNLPVITSYEAGITIKVLDVQETDNFAYIIQYLCGNFRVGETIIVDISSSCLAADILAIIFQPYIRPTYTGCYCAHASNLLPENDPIIITAIEFIKLQRTTLAKIIIFADTCHYSPSVLDVVQSAIPLFTADLKTANISQWLSKFTRETIRHYVILVGTTYQINEVLCAAKRMGLPTTFTWIVHVLDDHDYSSVSCLPSQLFTITTTRDGPHYENSQYTEAFNNILPSFWPWLENFLNTETNTSQMVGNICQEDYSRQTFDFPVFQPEIQEFGLKQNFPLNGTSFKVGKWTATDGFAMYLKETEIKDLLVVTLHEPPFVYIEETDNDTVYSGYAIDVLDKIAKRLGLTYRIYTVSDGRYGRQKANGDWDGLVGEIVKGCSIHQLIEILKQNPKNRLCVDRDTPVVIMRTEREYEVEGTTIQDYFERMAALEMNFYEMWRNMSYKTNSGSNQQSLAVFDYPLGDPFQTINTNIKKTGVLKNSQEGLKKVLAENFAMIHESPMLQYEMNQDCRLMAVGKQFSTKYYAFALPQRSFLTKLISKTILDMQSGVIFDSLKEKWWKGSNSSQECTDVDESDGLTFSTMGGIFLVMVFGIGLGLLVLLIETIYHYCFILKRTRQKAVTVQNSRTNLAEDFYSLSSNNAQHIETCDL